MFAPLLIFAIEEKGISALGIDPKAILFQAGTFVILFVLIRKFALDKIVKSLKDREDTINEGLVNAEKAAKASEQALQEQEKILQSARKEADLVLAKAHEEAGSIVKQAEDLATSKTETMIGDAKKRIENDVEKAKLELKNEVRSLVVQATEQLIHEKLDEKKDEKLIKSAIEGRL